MSTTYAGNAANYPANITIPSDGDAFAAAAFSVPYEGLADRTAYLAAAEAILKTIPCLSWEKVGTAAAYTAFAFGGDENGSNPARAGIWFGIGTNVLGYSQDFGRTWTAISPPTGALTGYDIALRHDDGTRGVAVNDGSADAFYNATAGNLASWSLATLPAAYSSPNVRWAEDSSLFCAVGLSGGATVVSTSPTGAVWTARTAPTWPTSAPQASALAYYAATNTLVWLAQDSAGAGGTIHIATSTDGGVTWTVLGTRATSSTRVLERATFDQTTGRLFITLQGSVDEISYSDDLGATWTSRLFNGAGSSISNVAAMNGVAVCGKQGTLVYSPNGGANWYPAIGLGQVSGATTPPVASGGGGFIAVTNTTIFASARYRASVAVDLTT